MTYLKNGIICSHFNRQEYDKNDEFGRGILRSFLEDLGYEVKNNDGKGTGKINYEKPDIQAIKKNKTLLFEPEVKKGITTNAWNAMLKYETIHIPARKEKYKEIDYFCVIKFDGTEMVMVPGKFVKMCFEKNNKEGCEIIKKRARGELENFFSIPNHLCIRLRKKQGKWVKLEW